MASFPRCVLVVDEDPATRRGLARELHPIFLVVQAETFDAALRVMCNTHALVAVISGQELGSGPGGAQLQVEVRRRLPAAARVLLSGTMNKGHAARLLADGVIHSFLEQPWSVGAVLEVVSDRLGLLALA